MLIKPRSRGRQKRWRFKDKELGNMVLPPLKTNIHRKKRFTSFPSPTGMSLTKLLLGRNNSVMTSLFPPRESLVVIPAGDGKIANLFFTV